METHGTNFARGTTTQRLVQLAYPCQLSIGTIWWYQLPDWLGWCRVTKTRSSVVRVSGVIPWVVCIQSDKFTILACSYLSLSCLLIFHIETTPFPLLNQHSLQWLYCKSWFWLLVLFRTFAIKCLLFGLVYPLVVGKSFSQVSCIHACLGAELGSVFVLVCYPKDVWFQYTDLQDRGSDFYYQSRVGLPLFIIS